MNYEKLSVERFAQKLQEDEYKGLTGARRAIGKCRDWSKKEKEKAQELANAYFGGSPVAPKVAKPAKKAAAPAAKKAAKPAKKAAAPAKLALVAEKPAKAPKAAKPAKKAAALAVSLPEPVRVQRGVNPAETNTGAAGIVNVLGSRALSLTPLEQQTYEMAQKAYQATMPLVMQDIPAAPQPSAAPVVAPSSLAALAAAAPALPKKAPAGPPAAAKAATAAPSSAGQRILMPPPIPRLTPEEIEHRRQVAEADEAKKAREALAMRDTGELPDAHIS